MKTLSYKRVRVTAPESSLIYVGPADGINLSEVKEILDGMVNSTPLVRFLPSGAVERNLSDTASWASWLIKENAREFMEAQIDCDFEVQILSDIRKQNLNLRLRYISRRTNSSITHISFIQRKSEDDFVCFE